MGNNDTSYDLISLDMDFWMNSTGSPHYRTTRKYQLILRPKLEDIDMIKIRHAKSGREEWVSKKDYFKNPYLDTIVLTGDTRSSNRITNK